MNYKVYVNSPKGWEDITKNKSITDLEIIQEIIDGLDNTKYYEYFVIKKSENGDELLAHRYLDYDYSKNVKTLRKK